MGTILPIIGGALLVVIGNLLGKLRPNWFVGIRTPWTLSSKTSWVRTHQVGGWMFMLDGIAFMIAGLIHRRWAAVAAFAFLFAEALTLIVYSYRVWRDDPDKMPPAGTLPA
jgi:uncharacterized membrane protein